ncbi:MAG TPA: RsmD family RNA methyltransferase [Thermoanaerobaculia bacterium]|nr:RsmD family RNA methyltransferase [Thermoanaerobaculia bacterium]
MTAGSLRGRRVPVPPRDVRPTSERARQAFFNIVADRIAGALFLDLFAGSGIFSFEAVSRGAAASVAIDNSRRHTEAITKLANEFDADVATITADVLAGIARLGDRIFDIAYADPPYDYAQYDELRAAIGGHAVFYAIEHRRRQEPFTVEPTRRVEYGEVWISLFENQRN